MRATASAPGKLLLAGEYAVLDGAPAVVMAIDRRAVVAAMAPAPGVAAPGSLLEAVCTVLGCPCPGEVRMNTEAFHGAAAGAAVKIGLGSSAALAAALCRLLLPADAPAGHLLRSAIDAHRRFQHGVGSGADVAASVIGGVLRYCRDATTPPERLSWPQGLLYSVWWSGVPASTPAKLERLSRAALSPARQQLADAAARVAGNWSSDLGTGLLPALDAYVTALEHFDSTHGLGVFDAGHRELRSAARSVDVLYKPCGAGGGDTGIAFAAAADALDAFAERARHQGFSRLDLAVDERGAILEEGTP